MSRQNPELDYVVILQGCGYVQKYLRIVGSDEQPSIRADSKTVHPCAGCSVSENYRSVCGKRFVDVPSTDGICRDQTVVVVAAVVDDNSIAVALVAFVTDVLNLSPPFGSLGGRFVPQDRCRD